MGKLFDEILGFWWKTMPVSASFAGVHDYDRELDRVERDFQEGVNQQARVYLARLNAIPRSELTADEAIDARLVCDSLESGIKHFEEVRYWQKNPSGYAELCLYGLFVLVIREFAPIEERAASFLARLKQVPRVLTSCRPNLVDSPEVFTRLAIEVAESGAAFFPSVVPMLAERVPALRAELTAAGQVAAGAFADYARFLATEHLPRSRGDFAIGRELFDYKLVKDHMLPWDAEALRAIGEQARRTTEEELAALARSVGPGQDWWDVVAEIKRDHPTADGLQAAYEQAMVAARDFVRDRGLVTIPPGEELEVIPTPVFDRPTIPYAAYMAPAPFEKQQKGHFFVTPVDRSASVERCEEVLRGHSNWGIPITALHEGYPGHHLQLVHANRVPSKVRRVLGTSVFIEGWALYCEEMMHDQGFYTDPRTRLLKLKDQLWRACRVLIDVGLHTRTMTFAEAVGLLVNTARLERVHAEKEVTRYTYTPTQPLSYLIGKRQILDLRRDCETRSGPTFDLRAFHDQLLSYGSIPVALVRTAMGR